MQFGIFIYDDVEPIDLATFGVLSMARRIAPEISICTIAPRAGPVALANGLKVTDYRPTNTDKAESSENWSGNTLSVSNASRSASDSNS